MKTSFAYMMPGLKNNGLTPNRIIDLVCRHFKTSYGELRTTSRARQILNPRQVAMYLIRKNMSKYEITSTNIGLLFRRDHATVLNAVKIVQNQMDTDAIYKRTVDELTSKLSSL